MQVPYEKLMDVLIISQKGSSALMKDVFDSFEPGPTFLEMAYTLLSLWFEEEEVTYILKTLNVSIVTCVLDTNILLNDLKYAVQRKSSTALIEAARIGSLKLFAS